MSRNLGNWTTISCVFANFLLRMRRNGQNSTSGEIFNPKFEIPMGGFLFEYEFWWHFRQDLYVFSTKNGFCNAKFSEFGGWRGWGWPFFDETPKRYILGRFHAFRAIMRANPFKRFVARRLDDKKGHYKKSPICGEFPTQPNLTKTGVWVGVADVINYTKFGDDWSREYKVTEGRILACTIGMACRL